MFNPLISLVMATHNAEFRLEKTLRSFIQQTFTNFELIAADNHSTDATAAIIKTAAASDNRIKYLLIPEERRQSTPLTSATATASGLYIGFINAGDEADTDCLATLIKPFSTHNVDFTAGFTQLYNEATNEILQPKPANCPDAVGGIITFHNFINNFNYKTICPQITLFKKSLFTENDLHFIGTSFFENDELFWKILAISPNGFFHTQKFIYTRYINPVTEAEKALTSFNQLPALLRLQYFFQTHDLYDERIDEALRIRAYKTVLPAVITALKLEKNRETRARLADAAGRAFAEFPPPRTTKTWHARLRRLLIRLRPPAWLALLRLSYLHEQKTD